jgi:hypothetical protein
MVGLTKIRKMAEECGATLPIGMEYGMSPEQYFEALADIVATWTRWKIETELEKLNVRRPNL